MSEEPVQHAGAEVVHLPKASATCEPNVGAPNGHGTTPHLCAGGHWHRRQRSDPAADTNEVSATSELRYPTSHEGPGYDVEVPTVTTRKYAVIMVGLPARGKTFLAQKITRYLAWLGHNSAVFNVQRLWREELGVTTLRHAASTEFTASCMTRQNTSDYTSATPSPPREHSDSPPALSGRHYIPADTFFEAFAFGGAEQFVKTSYGAAVEHSVKRVRDFFNRGGLVAFINDDFVTRESRDFVESKLLDVADQVLYIEVLRDDDSNIRFEHLKVSACAEYGADAGTTDAASDFAKRVALLKSVYENVGDEKSYIRVRNNSHVEVHQVRGYLPSRMISFLMHLSPQNKVFCPIYFSRHGQSEYNLEDRLGGNPRLTSKGRRDALALRNFLEIVKREFEVEQHSQMLGDAAASAGSNGAAPAFGQSLVSNSSIPGQPPRLPKPMQIWTSQLTRTIETARPAEVELGIQCLRWRNLNEIHAGVCEHMTYGEVKERYPIIHDFRKKNKYSFRYPDGESYQDLVARLEPVIMELENADRVVVVVAHQAVLRALLAYFGGSNAEHSVHVEVPHRTVWRCSYDGAGIPTIDEMRLPEVADDPEADALAATSTTNLNFKPTVTSASSSPSHLTGLLSDTSSMNDGHHSSHHNLHTPKAP